MQQPRLRLRADRLRAAMNWAGVLTPATLASASGVSLQTAHRWIKGQCVTIDAQNLFALADRLQVSGRWLMGDDCPPGRREPLTPDEALLVTLYRSATPHVRGWILHIASLQNDPAGR